MFHGFVRSPLGAFKKSRSGKLCIISDLSWLSLDSINHFIAQEDFIKFDDIIRGIQHCADPIFLDNLKLIIQIHHGATGRLHGDY